MNVQYHVLISEAEILIESVKIFVFWPKDPFQVLVHYNLWKQITVQDLYLTYKLLIFKTGYDDCFNKNEFARYSYEVQVLNKMNSMTIV